MDSELRHLICQLQGLAEHFVEIARIVRMLRPHVEEQKPRRGKWFSVTKDKKEKRIWTRYQDEKFEDLKTVLFSILHRGHMLTRNTVLKVYNPYNVSNPIHIDTSKTVIVAHAEHILVLRGDTDEEHFLKVTEQCIGKGAHPPPSNVIHRYPLQSIRPFSLSGGNETCWRCGPSTEGEKTTTSRIAGDFSLANPSQGDVKITLRSVYLVIKLNKGVNWLIQAVLRYLTCDSAMS